MLSEGSGCEFAAGPVFELGERLEGSGVTDDIFLESEGTLKLRLRGTGKEQRSRYRRKVSVKRD